MKKKAKFKITVLATVIAVAFSAFAMPSTAMTTEAAAKTYKVVYKLNGGKNHKANPKKIKKNKSVKLKNPTKKGYTFKGWYKDKKFKKKTIKITGSKKAANRTVYAKWAKNKTVKKPAATKKPATKPTTPNTSVKPQDTNTGNTGNTDSTKPTTPNKPTENTENTAPTTPSKPLENPADMYCVDGRNDTHNWETETISSGLRYINACGYDFTDLYKEAWHAGNTELANLYLRSGCDSPYLYDDEKMVCPGCKKYCNTDMRGPTGQCTITQGNDVKLETKCTRCGQVRPDWFVQTSKH